jgi:NADH dehydrogenase FAD-containing subunit
VEVHTFATFIDTDGQSVWVDCGEHEEVIAYDLLIVCTGPVQTSGLPAGIQHDHPGVSVITC